MYIPHPARRTLFHPAIAFSQWTTLQLNRLAYIPMLYTLLGNTTPITFYNFPSSTAQHSPAHISQPIWKCKFLNFKFSSIFHILSNTVINWIKWFYSFFLSFSLL